MDPHAMDLLWRYYGLLEWRNPDHELTSITGPEAVVTKHFLDCAVVPSLVDLPSPLLDIGTGAGFPGVVLAIMKPDLRVILAEERPRKVAFLRGLVRELLLENVGVYAGRVRGDFPIPVAGVITRAVEPIATTLMRCAGFLSPKARAIFMKGPSVDPELRDAARRARHAYTLCDDIAYLLPGTRFRRRLLVYERATKV